MTKTESHKWEFKPRFRKGSFGWKSQPAITRIRQAVSEIKKVTRKDPIGGAEGAVILLERLSPAIEHVDGSSGAIGSAVNRAIEELVPIITNAPVDEQTRRDWLDRLWDAQAADMVPYLESLADYWGDLCASRQAASAWADSLINMVRMAWAPDSPGRGHHHGIPACLSALYRAGRHEELLELLELDRLRFWPYQMYAVKALAALGKTEEAISHAESCRGNWTSDVSVARVCEEILLAAGRAEEAYSCYALEANIGTSHLATYRAIARKYPHKEPEDILSALVESTPGEEGKWFATAKELGLFELAIELARRSPCDPRTLTRAARDYADSNPPFALGAGLCAVHWLLQGYGYEIAGADVWAAYGSTMQAAENLGVAETAREDMEKLLRSSGNGDSLTRHVLERALGAQAAARLV